MTGTFELDGKAAMMSPVLALDAWSWDAIMLTVADSSGGMVRPGQSFTIPAWDSSRAISFTTDAIGVNYRMAQIDVSVSGLAPCGTEACLELSFSAEGNELQQRAVWLSIEGMEYFVARALVSVQTGRLVRGDLWGPLIARFSQDGGDAATSLPISGILQSLRLQALEDWAGPDAVH